MWMQLLLPYTSRGVCDAWDRGYAEAKRRVINLGMGPLLQASGALENPWLFGAKSSASVPNNA